MKIYILFLLFLAAFFLPQNNISAQPQLWEVYTISDQPFINVVIEKYQSDSLYIKYLDKLIIMHQDSIQYLIKRNESKFDIGFTIGALGGGILSAANTSEDIFSEISNFTSVVIGAFLGGIIGGLAGLTAGTDDKYYIEEYDTEMKRKLLTRLFPNKLE